ncbi:MAG: SUMF1/EgtB/PvdO family nonheme iron enzyme [Planctomycetes bacterium]|nr:SUMF1/EgtB/PvdO family nonheme iron enzyme [Planctomycetota bacterium]
MASASSVPDRDPPSLETLLADCLARFSHGGGDPLPELCARHPEHADALRRRYTALQRMGLLDKPTIADRRIGAFTLRRELGAGGMGQVWLADQEQPVRRLVALKLMHERLGGGHALARFQAERQALAQLSHPGIAQVFEAGTTDDGRPWFAMEFVDGQPLQVFCKERRLAVPARLHLLLQLCDAVQHAHQRGILHRDLKPGNVLVCERTGPVVKVIDFGLAKALQEPLAGAMLTEAGQVLGTPEYMSPEQALPGPDGVDTRADVYALGTIAYELLCGVLPFDFATLRQQGFLAMQQAIAVGTPLPPSRRLREPGIAEAITAATGTTVAALERQLRGDLDWIVGKAIARERNERYASVSELAADLRRHLAGRPVMAGPPSTFYHVRKFVRRHRVVVAASLLTVLGLLVALVVSLESRAQAVRSLDRFDTLQVALDLERLVARAPTDTWPALPAQLGAMDRWLTEYEAIVAQRPRFEAQRDDVAAGGVVVDGELQQVSPRDAFLHRQIGLLLAELTRLQTDGVSTAVASRRAFAASLRQRSVDEQSAAWANASAAIAERYGGLHLLPQVGLWPLGPDPTSGLWEFALLQPDERLPERVDGRWRIEADTGVVLVLIPGGEVTLGVAPTDARLPYAPHDSEYEATAEGGSPGRALRVRLEPYFLAKYELTQAQWGRLFRSNPSQFSAESSGARGVTPVHPVNTIDWRAAAEAARRLGGCLPSSARWEHAARAHGDAPWWTGYSVTPIEGAENLADESFVRGKGVPQGEGGAVPFDDTWPLTAPVDSLRANPFGLHHMLGNVREYTADPYHKYVDARPRHGDGAVEPVRAGEVLEPSRRDLRGGSFMSTWLAARATLRNAVAVTTAGASSGLRLCREIEPDRPR